jgi:AraC family transcriptional regulator
MRRIVVRGCALSEFDYAPDVRVYRGPAAHPTLTVTLAGCAMESDTGGVAARRRMTCTFVPASWTSVAHVSEEGWRILVVALSEPWALDAVRHLDLRAPAGSNDGWIHKLCERLALEFGSGDGAAGVAIEGLVVQMLAEVARWQHATRERRPQWLDAVRAFIDVRFLTSIKLLELAKAAGVHPAHLSKTFTRAFGCTIGEYVRDRRVEFARRQMESSALTLSEIAFAAGFADQSHFTKTFKRIVGTSPSEYRQTAARLARAVGER